MAILKHIASRNGRYSDIIEYLTFEHDAKTGKVLRDEDGNKIRREGVLMDGLLCDPATFELDCFEANRQFGKNQGRNEVKSHSYIISFDPRDAVDNGLTKEMVQEFGLEFARKYLPGYQTIVCTHEDGHNGSGNMHCHVVINSLRIENTESFPYTDRRIDSLAGYKHHCTVECERFLKGKVMEMCQQRDLYQANLLEPTRRRITDHEYYLGFKSLEEKATPFITVKEQLRMAIRSCAGSARSIEEFKNIMSASFQVTVKESRGRFSFIVPGREHGITDRQLGTDYTKTHIEEVIHGKADFIDTPLPYYKASFYKSEIGKMSDLSQSKKAAESPGYAYRVKLSNLQKMAESVTLLSDQNLGGLRDLGKKMEDTMDLLQDNQDILRSVESQMNELRSIMELVDMYTRLKPVADAFKDAKHSEQYRKEHEGDLLLFQTAKKKLKSQYSLKSLPSSKLLKQEYEQLSNYRNSLYEDRSLIRKLLKDLENAKYNLEMMLGREKNRIIER